MKIPFWHPEKQFPIFQPFEGWVLINMTQSIHLFFFLFFKKFFFSSFWLLCSCNNYVQLLYCLDHPFCWFVSFLPVLCCGEVGLGEGWGWGVSVFCLAASILAHDASWQFQSFDASRGHRAGRGLGGKKAKSPSVEEKSLWKSGQVARVCTMAELHLGRPGCLLRNTIEKCLQDF